MSFEFPQACPHCHSEAGFRKLQMEEKGGGLGIYLFGGLLAWGAHQSAHQNKIVCTQCGYAFTPSSNLPARSLIRLTFLFLILAACLALGFYFGNQ